MSFFIVRNIFELACTQHVESNEINSTTGPFILILQTTVYYILADVLKFVVFVVYNACVEVALESCLHSCAR